MKVFKRNLKLINKNIKFKRYYVSNEQNRVLITGCLGQIGSELVNF